LRRATTPRRTSPRTPHPQFTNFRCVAQKSLRDGRDGWSTVLILSFEDGGDEFEVDFSLLLDEDPMIHSKTPTPIITASPMPIPLPVFWLVSALIWLCASSRAFSSK
jgi:hypothetical protein